MLNPNKNLIESSYFVDETAFNEYNINIANLRGIKMFKNFNNQSLLYTKQKGACGICKTGLSYLSS